MGCDIHIYVEKKTNGKWECIDELERDKDGDLQHKGKEIYEGRNYSLFALLANVRNYSDIVPISQPKGLPSDVSAEVKEISGRWNNDGHSHSYFTLRELLEYDFEKKMIPEKGFLPKESWERFQKSVSRGKPNYETLYPRAGWANPDLGWEQHEWKVPAKTIDTWFYEKTIPRLESMGDPDNIRIVFWFDN